MTPAARFRHANVLPSALIERKAGQAVRAIRLQDLSTLPSTVKWWQYEQLVEIDFDSDAKDDSAKISSVCGACGACCKDIPSHQIGIYMSPTERRMAEASGHEILTQGEVTVEGVAFAVLAVDAQGDCAMLGPKGCTLGNLKPLWCKIYHCEKFVGSAPPWMLLT